MDPCKTNTWTDEGVVLTSKSGVQDYNAIDPDVLIEDGKWYLAFNPTLERSFHGPAISQGVSFSPNAKVGYALTKKVNAGFEYYGSVGSVTGWDPLRDQQQQFVPSMDLDLGPNWEFNFGIGVGVTQATDHLLVKMIIGRRFGSGSRKAKEGGRDDIPAKGPDAGAKK